MCCILHMVFVPKVGLFRGNMARFHQQMILQLYMENGTVVFKSNQFHNYYYCIIKGPRTIKQVLKPTTMFSVCCIVKTSFCHYHFPSLCHFHHDFHKEQAERSIQRRTERTVSFDNLSEKIYDLTKKMDDFASKFDHVFSELQISKNLLLRERIIDLEQSSLDNA